jgi:hypothetical protein
MGTVVETGRNYTLSQKIAEGESLTTVKLSDVPVTATSGVLRFGSGNNVEWMSYSARDESANTVTINTRGLNNNATGLTDGAAGNQKTFAVGTPVKLVEHSLQINNKVEKDEDGTITADLTFSGDIIFSLSIRMPVYADATARDAAITSPTNGMLAYLTDEGVMYQYIGGDWTTFATGTTANGSTTVAGKFEEATVAEQGTATATGGTGARLVPANANLVKSSSGAGDENKIALLGSDGKFASGFVPSEELQLTAGENLTAGDLTYPESDGKAYKSIKNVSSAVQIDSITSDASHQSRNLYISDSKFVTFYKNSGNFYVVAGTVLGQTGTFGSPVIVDATGTTDVAMALIDTDKFVIIYRDDNDGSKLYGTVCTLSGTTITPGTPVKLYDTEAMDNKTIDVCKLDTDKFLAVGHGSTSDDPIAIACTVSGTVITAGTGAALEAVTMATNGAVKCEQLVTDVAVCYYDDGTNVSVVNVTISGTTITTKTIVDLYTGFVDGDANIWVQDVNNIFLLNYVAASDIIMVNTIGNDDQATWDKINYLATGNFALQTGEGLSMAFHIGLNRIGVTYTSNAGGDVSMDVYELYTSGANKIFTQQLISGFTTPSIFAGGKLSEYGNKLVITTRDSGDSNKIKYSVFLDTSDQFSGVVKTTVSATETATLLTGENATISGLTAGRQYYVGDAGAVATSGVRPIGFATTTTNLYLK